MMQRKRKSKQAQPALKAKWRANIDDHPIGLAWSPDAKNLAVAGVSGPITLFNGADGSVLHKLPGHALRHDGDFMAQRQPSPR